MIGLQLCGLDSVGSGYGPVAGPFEHNSETSASKTGVKFLTH
jgi:hypothetical protein